MSKLNIFLADLEHNYNKSPHNAMPYAIGLIASYAKKIFGDKISIKLFKHPEKLIEALKKERCDIFGGSTYVWNSRLAHLACRTVKKNNPNTITVLGGPDFEKMPDLKKEYFKRNEYVDLRVAFEGEIAFANIIKLVLEHGITNKDKILSDKINGCVYLDKKNNALVESKQERIHSLSVIPSPYITGLLDEFFDGHLNPSIQTSRGCPFKCNFCHESDDYFAKIKFLETQNVLEELEYIAKKMHETKNTSMLVIADSNFGMFTRDKIVSEKILELQKKYNWPHEVNISIGKNERIIETTYMLKEMFEFTMSVQSMNKKVLEATGRTNIPIAKFKRMTQTLREGGRSTLSETIVPLPEETVQTYFEGTKELIDMKVQRIVSNTLNLHPGTIYEDKKFLDKYGYKTKFRLLTTEFGIYDGEKIFEVEKVGVSTKQMNFNDYLATRKLTFLVEMIYNSKILREFEFFLEDYKLNYYDYVFFVYKEIENSPKSVREIFQSLEDQSVKELKETEEDLIKYYSEEDNFKKIVKGEEGNNLKFTHKALLLSKHKDAWLGFIFSSLKKFLEERNVKIEKDFYDILSFTKYKYEGIFDFTKTRVPITAFFNYDIISWLEQKKRTKPLKKFLKKDKVKIKFLYNKREIERREYLFKQFNEGSKHNLCNIIIRIRPHHKILRNYEYAKPLSSLSYDYKEDVPSLTYA